MASEITALRGHTPYSTRQAASTHAFPTNVPLGALILVGVAGYTDLDPTDAVTVADISQTAGTAALSSWQLHRTDKRDAGSVEIDSAIFSARVLTAGSLTVQIAKAIDRYWTIGGTGLSGNWDDSRAISVTGQAQVGPDVTSVTPGGLNAVAGDVLVGAFTHNSLGGTGSATVGAPYASVWSEPDASLYCVGGMALRIAAGSLTADGPVWTLAGGIATNGGVASSMVLLREVAGGSSTPATVFLHQLRQQGIA